MSEPEASKKTVAERIAELERVAELEAVASTIESITKRNRKTEAREAALREARAIVDAWNRLPHHDEVGGFNFWFAAHMEQIEQAQAALGQDERETSP